ncbi:hypothetical protein DNTS_031845 [Danionella cerebrum]|uniref:Uncharacterized protein n=1 Tax=Danionella cerebrum TaxID=2873325 RepID=A0A553QH72_9TELE|nr:hypothetical protein DNTS_031845 [Danionella translucida]
MLEVRGVCEVSPEVMEITEDQEQEENSKCKPELTLLLQSSETQLNLRLPQGIMEMNAGLENKCWSQIRRS